MTEVGTFSGFSTEAIQFLRDLAGNNDRAWFQPRKADYERLLKEPMEDLCATLGAEFAARSIPLESDPIRSPFRIYRDVRFSKDKSPYKTYMSASFPWIGEGSGVGGYFHFSPDEVYVGGGMWHPEPAKLAAWRQVVAERSEAVHAALGSAAFRATFGEVEGDRLKRAPAGFPQDHPDAELLKLKDVTFGKRLSEKDVRSPALPRTIANVLVDGLPVLRLLAALPG
jgi:uncharacterized protein (TIGR02453 family)